MRCVNLTSHETNPERTSGNGGLGYRISVNLLSAFGFESSTGEFVVFSYGDQVQLPSMRT